MALKRSTMSRETRQEPRTILEGARCCNQGGMFESCLGVLKCCVYVCTCVIARTPKMGVGAVEATGLALASIPGYNQEQDIACDIQQGML